MSIILSIVFIKSKRGFNKHCSQSCVRTFVYNYLLTWVKPIKKKYQKCMSCMQIFLMVYLNGLKNDVGFNGFLAVLLKRDSHCSGV